MSEASIPSADKKHLRFSLLVAGVMIGAGLILTWARSAELVKQGSVERTMSVVMGLAFAAYFNALPKFFGPSPRTLRDATVAQANVRVCAWAMTLAFLAYAGLWALAPADFARVGSIVAVAASGAVVLGFSSWKYLASRR